MSQFDPEAPTRVMSLAEIEKLRAQVRSMMCPRCRERQQPKTRHVLGLFNFWPLSRGSR